MAAKKPGKQEEVPRSCPKCKGLVRSSDVVVEYPGWKARYLCRKCKTRTPTSQLRRS